MEFSFNRKKLAPEVTPVDIDPTTHAYRHANWDPYGTIHEIDLILLDTNNDGEHLWDSPEQFQMMALTSWMAGIRQIIGNNLLGVAEQTHKNRKVPRDVLAIAYTHYEEAARWLRARDDVAITDSLAIPADLLLAMEWPRAGEGTPVSADLMDALRDTIEQLLYIHHPSLARVLSDPYMEPIFTMYLEILKKDELQLLHRIEQTQRLGGSALDPNQKPGSDVFNEYTAILEALVAYGAHKLAPVIRDEQFRTVPRPKKPHTVLPAFTATPEDTTIALPVEEPTLAHFAPQPEAPDDLLPLSSQPVVITLEQFNPVPPDGPEKPEKAEDATPILPKFSPGTETAEPVTPSLPKFTPVDEERDDPTEPVLPRFDPGAEHATDEQTELTLPRFDPTKDH